MIDILLTTAIISLTVLGARTVTDEGMIGFPLREWVLRSIFGRYTPPTGWRVNSWRHNLWKPIILCCVCMPSVWGLGIHYLLHGWTNIQYYPLEALSSAFINAVMWTGYEYVKVLQSMQKDDE